MSMKNPHDVTSKKLVRAKRGIRCIYLASVILTLISLGYGIYFTIECRNTLNNYDCALTSGKSGCSGIAEVLVASGLSLMCMLSMLGGHAHMRNGLFVAAAIQAGFGGLLLLLSANTAFLTEGTPEQIYEEMTHCHHGNHTDHHHSDEAECWERFQDEFCSDWMTAETLICTTKDTTTIATVTEHTTGSSINREAMEIIKDCTSDFETYAEDQYSFYTVHAYAEMFIMAGFYLLLALGLILVGKSYEKERTRLLNEVDAKLRQEPNPADRQNSRSLQYPGSYQTLAAAVEHCKGGKSDKKYTEMEDPTAKGTSDKTKLIH